jgi:hypothetical protein
MEAHLSRPCIGRMGTKYHLLLLLRVLVLALSHLGGLHDGDWLEAFRDSVGEHEGERY